MEAALLGMIGVVIGAFISGGSEFVMRRRDERSTQRASLRLTATAFHMALAVSHDAEATGRWGAERGRLPVEIYPDHAPTLARTLTSEHWKLLEGSLLGMLRMDGIRAEMVEGDREATASELSDLRRIRRHIQRTVETIDSELWAIEAQRSTP